MHTLRSFLTHIGFFFIPPSDGENNTSALLIERFLELDNWKILEITDEIPFDTQMACPADGTLLTVICTLVGKKSTKKIRLGCCASCGYIGYIDRPIKAWITEFYAETWDNALRIDSEREGGERRNAFLHDGIDSFTNVRANQITEFLKQYSIPKDKPVLDIGCGYGTSLKYLEKFGFKKLYGIENSRHRAYVASYAYDLSMTMGAFEDATVQQACHAVAPFGFIMSHHVMEHVYDPKEIIQLSADLQEEGGYLMMSLPNLKGEPSMQTIIYFPHLHSFTKESFGRLLENNGYEVLDDSFTNRRELFFLARKTGKKNKGNQLSEEKNIRWVRDKFTHALGFGRSHWFSRRRLWWYRPLGIDRGGQIAFFGSYMLDNALYAMYLCLDRVTRRRRSPIRQSCVVRDVKQRYTFQKESPIEIQFEKNILMTYK